MQLKFIRVNIFCIPGEAATLHVLLEILKKNKSFSLLFSAVKI